MGLFATLAIIFVGVSPAIEVDGKDIAFKLDNLQPIVQEYKTND